MKSTIFAFSLCLLLLSNNLISGPCDYPDDIAADGSRCGDRAASVRPGGRDPGFNFSGIIAVIIGAGWVYIMFLGSKPKPQKKPKATRKRNTHTNTPKCNTGVATNKDTNNHEKAFYTTTKLNYQDDIERKISYLADDDYNRLEIDVAKDEEIKITQIIKSIKKDFEFEVNQSMFAGLIMSIRNSNFSNDTTHGHASRYVIRQVVSQIIKDDKNSILFVDNTTRTLLKVYRQKEMLFQDTLVKRINDLRNEVGLDPIGEE
jgi:CRISPR/Cas system-associated endoribonuclease Cas2